MCLLCCFSVRQYRPLRLSRITPRISVVTCCKKRVTAKLEYTWLFRERKRTFWNVRTAGRAEDQRVAIAVFPIMADVVEVKTGCGPTTHWSVHFILLNEWLRHSFVLLITLLDIGGSGQNWEDSSTVFALSVARGLGCTTQVRRVTGPLFLAVRAILPRADRPPTHQPVVPANLGCQWFSWYARALVDCTRDCCCA